jgi:uncharacterized BrkB/YihY/UPF0761 family membrane protein
MPDDEQPPPGESRRHRLTTHVERAKNGGYRGLAWGRASVPGVDAVAEAWDTERVGGGSLLAGGIAYRLFFWLLPLGLVAASVLSFWVDADEDGFEDAAEELGMGGAAAQSAATAIAAGHHSRWYLLVVGVVLVGYFSIGVVRALLLAHALAWRAEVVRLRRPIRAGAIFTGVVLGLMLVSGIAAWLREQDGGLGVAFTLAILGGYVGVALWVMSVLPHVDAPTRALLPGAVLLAVGMQAIHLVVVLYLTPRLGRSSALYGSLGAATVILLWLYLTARLIVMAAFLNATVWRRRTRSQPAAPAPAGGDATR